MVNSGTALLVVQCLATAAMTGIIWFVQLVHYPLFADVGAAQFVGYENENTRRTSWVVGPLMLVEAVSALVIPFWTAREAAREREAAGDLSRRGSARPARPRFGEHA